MSPAHVLEPTYEAIKARLKIGRWQPGLKLEAARLAEKLGVSMTPVRDSLWRLAGERLVDVVPGEGFRVPRPTASELRDLLELNCALLLAALAAERVPGIVTPPLSAGTPADRTAALFLLIAGRSGNAAFVQAIAGLNDRLHLMRSVEGDVIPNVAGQLAELEELAGNPNSICRTRTLILGYHLIRAEAAEHFARMIAAGSAPGAAPP